MIEYFDCTRVNRTTFLIHEKDKYTEHPFIYAKVYDDLPVIVLSDTGCGGGVSENLCFTNLKVFLETCPVDSNGGRPLNPQDSSGKPTRKYIIICTHCHYDHILGLEHFQDAAPEIVASWEGKSFIEQNLPEHSLCKFLDIDTPRYKVTHWARDLGTISFDGKPLNIQIIHTPGHTPDELAWYDQQERHLFVGDSFYERLARDGSYEQAILFPKEGNIIEYQKSLDKLLSFVEAENTGDNAHKAQLRVGCGHVTSSVDAKEILLAVRKLFSDILEGLVPIIQKEQKRGEEYVTWRQVGEPRFSVTAPRRIVDDAQQAFQAK